MRMKLDYTEPEPQGNEKDDIIDRTEAGYNREKGERQERTISGWEIMCWSSKPRKKTLSTPYKPVFYVLCSIRGSQVTARRVTDWPPVCRDAIKFKLANAVINATDEPEKNEEVQTPQADPDVEIPEKETPTSTSTDPPDTTATAETSMEPPGAEIIPGQGAEHITNQWTDQY